MRFLNINQNCSQDLPFSSLSLQGFHLLHFLPLNIHRTKDNNTLLYSRVALAFFSTNCDFFFFKQGGWVRKMEWWQPYCTFVLYQIYCQKTPPGLFHVWCCKAMLTLYECFSGLMYTPKKIHLNLVQQYKLRSRFESFSLSFPILLSSLPPIIW